MIKKIDANKYGVVRYAISSIEDIADLPREVSVGSEAILVNEDGEKKFRLGSDGWVEVVEVKEYDEDKLRDILEDAKVGYGGIEYETLEERLDRDFDNAYSVLDNRAYVEYEGCRITAKDSLNGLQKETVVKGRTLQNIVPTKIYNDKSCYGSLSSDARLNGTTVSCVASGGYRNMFINLNEFNLIKQNTDYTIILTIHKNTLVGEGNLFTFSNKDQTIQAFDLTINAINNGLSVGTYKFVGRLKNDISECSYLFRTSLNSGATSGEIEFSYCMFEGDYTQTPLEELPFIEGIESVGDKSKNLFDGKTRNGYYSSGEFKVNSSNLANVNPIEIKPNTYYTGSGDAPPRMTFYDSDMNFISYNSNSSTCLSPSNAKYMNIHAMNATYFQIEEGTQETPYEPYYEGYKISGKSCGKNLFDVNSLIENKKIDENGKVVNDERTVLTDFIKLKENTMYSYTVQNPSGVPDAYNGTRLSFYDINKNLIKQNWMVYNKTFNSNNSCYLRIYFFITGRQSDTTLENIKTAILEESPTPTTYEPYKETTYSYILDEPLHSLPNGACDEIDLEKGVVTRRVGKVVLDGSENWSITRTNSLSTIFGIAFKSNNDTKDVICDTFNGTFIPIFSDGDEAVKLNNTTIFISILNNKLSTVDANGFKQWLQANPTTVYYELVTPITEYLIKDDKFVTLPNGVKDEAGRIVTRNVGKVVLNGSEKWTRSNIKNENHIKYFTYIDDENGERLKVDDAPIISPTFPVVGCGQNSGDLDKYRQDIEGLYADTTISISVAKNRLETEDAEGLKKWLSQNPITVYYELINPYMECSYEKYPVLPNGVKDEIAYNSVLRRVGKVVVDGSQVLTRSSTNSNKTKTTHFSVNGISSNSPYGICDKLPTTIDATLQVYEEPCMKLSSANKSDPPYTLWLNIDRSNADTVEEAYEYFRNNPHTVWYELTTPYVEPINLDEVILDTIRLKSYEPITHITSDNYLPPTIKTQVPSDFNAVVLGLKSNNEALTSQVMSLRQTNDELEATNREQDDVIDVTLLALDEVYGMIDESEIETMSMGSPMVNVYVKMIKRGIKTLDEVPAKYRAEVEKLI